MASFAEEIKVDPILNYGSATKGFDLLAVGPPPIPQEILDAVKMRR